MLYTLTLNLLLCALAIAADNSVPDVDNVKEKGIIQSSQVVGPEEVWAVESTQRKELIYPSNWGEPGIFRVRSAESLPEDAISFGIGGEFYSVAQGPITAGSSQVSTIAEDLFLGYSPTNRLTLAVMRRNSSTTFGNPQRLISSLGDFNFSGSYSFPLSPIFAVAPIVDLLIASDFNDLAPSGSTLSAGFGLAGTVSLYQALGIPLFIHANVIYHTPEMNGASPAVVAPETYYDFSRYSTIITGLGAEFKVGDFMPFIEFYDRVEANSGLSFPNNPSKISIGARANPLSNKSVSMLLGCDVGLGRGLVAGVPYTPPWEIIGQLSYTVGVTNTERKHYYTSADVGIVDRKFVIRKNINFKINSAELESDSTHLLDEIANVVKQNHVQKLLIVGHTDSTFNEDYNLNLSVNRANTVKKFLASRGVPEETLIAQGYGKRKPKASNATEAGRALNRRVEFYILE